LHGYVHPVSSFNYATPEIALSANYTQASTSFHMPVRILAILGSNVGIDVEADRAELKKLPNAKVKFLAQPTRQQLSDRLFEQHWDILFFAGHSSSQADGETGQIYINETDSLTIGELKYALRNAVQNGLKLTIFNSCDGLGLAQALADLQIPQMIVMREPVPDRVAQDFLKYFLNHFAKGKSFYLSVREAREQLQSLEGDYPRASWLPVICQNPAAPELRYLQWNWKKVSRLAAIGAIAFAGISIVVGKLWQEVAIDNRMSVGKRLLVQAVKSADKEAGVEAMFWFKDYQKAISKFESSLKQNRNDPETVIYLNNALIGDRPSLKIAVAIPIGSNLNVAQEILRGVAQTQEEVNHSGGVNGKLLQIEIANDDNDPEVSQKLATKFVEDRNILAVVGHNASDASVPAAQVYQKGGLLMISPTSFAKELADNGSYIFLTVPSISFVADTLVNYIVKTAHKTRIAICSDFNAKDNQSFRNEFSLALYAHGGKFINIYCDFSVPGFTPSTAISQAIKAGADGLLLAPHVDRIDKAIEVAQANKRQLALFGSPTLYTLQTLQSGQANVSGLVLAVPWHPAAIPGNPFVNNATKLWGGAVSWRTAMAYDATQAIAAGLKQSITRDGLQKVLHSPSFSAFGAMGTIQFLLSGERTGTAVLIKVQPNPQAPTHYSFDLLKTAVPR